MEAREIAAWLELTYDRDPAIRARAASKLCPCNVKRNASEVWERLLELARDSDLEVRKHVVHNLCDGSPREYEDRILQVLASLRNEPDRKLRRRVRHVLAVHRRTGRLNVL